MELERPGQSGTERGEQAKRSESGKKVSVLTFYHHSLFISLPCLVATVFVVLCMAVDGTYSATGPAVSAGRITKGPCLLRVCQDRVALMWETDTDGPSGVSYGEKDGPEIHRESSAERVSPQGWAVGGWKTSYIHKLWLEGLTPGRTYSYRITGPGVRSETFEFRTTPAETDEVRFIVYGDTRTQPVIHRTLVAQMSRYEVDFIVHVGDLVASGDDYRLWGPQFFEPLQGLMERVPIYTIKGNHEGRNGTYEKLLVPPGEGNDFGFDYGPLHYFCVDNASGWRNSGRLLGQIVRDAQESRAPWKFVSYHVPSMNFGGHKSVWQQKEVLWAFAAAGIDFVMTGHSHQYERFRPVQPPREGSFVTYITTGGGGAPLAAVAPASCHAYAQAVYHFCLFHIQGDRLSLNVIDAEGHTIDHLDIVKTGGHLDESYRSTAVPMSHISRR